MTEYSGDDYCNTIQRAEWAKKWEKGKNSLMFAKMFLPHLVEMFWISVHDPGSHTTVPSTLQVPYVELLLLFKATQTPHCGQFVWSVADVWCWRCWCLEPNFGRKGSKVFSVQGHQWHKCLPCPGIALRNTSIALLTSGSGAFSSPLSFLLLVCAVWFQGVWQNLLPLLKGIGDTALCIINQFSFISSKVLGGLWLMKKLARN